MIASLYVLSDTLSCFLNRNSGAPLPAFLSKQNCWWSIRNALIITPNRPDKLGLCSDENGMVTGEQLRLTGKSTFFNQRLSRNVWL